MSDRSRARFLIDAVDRLLTPPADALVRTNLFADTVAALTRLEVQVRRRIERQTALLWHAWNLPTAGDIRRVRAQLAAVEARLRDLSELLEDQRSEDQRSEARDHGGERAPERTGARE